MPEVVIPCLLGLLDIVRKWAGKHPSKYPSLFDGLIKDIEQRLKMDWVDERAR